MRRRANGSTPPGNVTRHPHPFAAPSEGWADELLRDSKDLAVIQVSTEGTITGWHGASQRVFGYAPHEAIGQLLATVFVPEDRARGIVELEFELARQTGRSEDDRWHLRQDGGRFWASGVLVRHCNARGELLGFFKLVRDRTDARIRYEALQRRAESLSRALARTSETQLMLLHELRNPLGALLNASAVLQDSSDAGARDRALKIVVRQSHALKRLLDDAADTPDTPQERLQLGSVILQDALSAAVEDFRAEAQQKGQTLRLIAPRHQVSLVVDSQRLHQMLLNLISNAVKYTPAGGHITVSATVEGNTASIKVEDDGVGISPQNITRIFELFTREDGATNDDPAMQPPGFGIGLAVVKRFAAMHGGFVEARSPGKGQGSLFIVQLPLMTAPRLRNT
jgi:PAS domain S-box-containing protein